MKSIRVTITATVVALFLLGFFFLPLPLTTRVRQPGLVQIQPEYLVPVHVKVSGKLQKVYVVEGEFVRKDKILAEFSNLDLENRYEQAKTTADLNAKLLHIFDTRNEQIRDPRERERLAKARQTAHQEMLSARNVMELADMDKQGLTIRAPRDGVVMGLPPVDDVGKRWEKEQAVPFCSIGDPTKLRVYVPLPPSDYELVRDNMERRKGTIPLPVTIRVQGRAGDTWTGQVSSLPKQEATTIPASLSSKGGGPLAVKPSSDPNHNLVPQAQVYLVGINIDHPDDAIAPGTLAQVKIHCDYRSAAWWTWRSISATFDLGLSF